MRTRRIKRKYALTGVYAIINTTNGKAMQVIVENEDYKVKYNVYDAIERLKKAGE